MFFAVPFGPSSTIVTEVKLGVYDDERTARALQGIVRKRLTLKISVSHSC